MISVLTIKPGSPESGQARAKDDRSDRSVATDAIENDTQLFPHAIERRTNKIDMPPVQSNFHSRPTESIDRRTGITISQYMY